MAGTTPDGISPFSRDDQNAILDGGRPSGQLDGHWREFFPEIIGQSEALYRVLETVAKVSRSDSAVLISGPSGTGKELIAAAVHRLSSRSSRRFVAINCSAIPEDLLESELFGHEKGAYTGADRRRAGLFETAEGGTIFLDEIGDMPMRLQVKLLRVLQERKYTPVGGNELKRADVRIVAATNVDLRRAVDDGRFRLDLFYRLNVIPIHLAALRERCEDVPLLLKHFLEISNRVHAVPNPCYFSDEAVAALAAYSWPGNIRELQNLVERVVILVSGGEVGVAHLPPEIFDASVARASAESRDSERPRSGATLAGSLAAAMPLVPLSAGMGGVLMPHSFGELPADGIDLPLFVENLENSLIQQALDRTQNNKNQAARLLGLNRTTLVERIKKRKIAPLSGTSEE